MPKVRLSTMISDIKGKSNGSVFSKNSGGVYFRNNPNGGGKKSANWDKQKNKFASLASSWRGLDNESQIAWNNATVNYPTTDAFGQTRIPSGYELFMRLNGHMSAVGLPQFALPASPRVTPSVGAVSVVYPDNWQLNPKACFANFDSTGVTNNSLLTSLGYLVAINPMSNKTYSFRFVIGTKPNFNFSLQSSMILFSVKNTSLEGIVCRIIDMDQTNPIIEITINADGKTWSKSFSIEANQLFKINHISFTASGSGFGALKVWFNGSNQILTESGDNTTVLPLDDFQPYFGQANQNLLLNLYLSDFRYYDYELNDENLNLVFNGYSLENELIWLDFITLTGAQITNFGILGAAYNFTSGNYTVTSKNIVPFSFNLIPLFSIDVQNEGLEGMYLNIYCSPPISNGKTGSFSNFKLLGSFAWTSNLNFLVQQEIQALFGNVPPNSEIRFKIDVLDSTTGDLVSKNIQAPRPTPRFKAGTDITEKVN